MAAVASGELRNGTCSILTPAVCMKSSTEKCWVAPKPGLANTILPGSAFAAAISSLTLLAAKSGRATISRLAVATIDTGSKAVSVS